VFAGGSRYFAKRAQINVNVGAYARPPLF